MLPSIFVPVDSLPLLPNGKVDRKALLGWELPTQKVHFSVAPRTETEETIAEIWANVLGVPAIDVQTDFFSLGGHSLLAMRILSRIRETYQVSIPLAAFFSSRTTVEGLSELVEEQVLCEATQEELAEAAADARRDTQNTLRISEPENAT
jgi:acyl carrier protein